MINWYPGHIAKAQKLLKQQLKFVDLVIEMLDARLPVSSHFKITEELIKGKSKILVLNKIDLAQNTSKWINYWKNKNIDVINLDLNEKKGLKELKKSIKQHKETLTKKLQTKNRPTRAIRIMVIGLPNVGKSTLINNLIKKKSLLTADRPGVTRQNQWIRIEDGIELLDTPGIIPPRFEDQDLVLKLIIIGSISDNAYEPIEVSMNIIKLLKEKYDYIDQDFTLENFTFKRNFLKEGGILDMERGARTFIRDLQKGKFGKITLDSCNL